MQSVTHCRMDGDLDWPDTGCVCSLDLGHAHSSWMGNSLDDSQLVIFADAIGNADPRECLSLCFPALSSLPILELRYSLWLFWLFLPYFSQPSHRI